MDEEINMGILIRKRLKKEGRTISWLAGKINCDSSNIHKIFRKSHLNSFLILQISQALDYDFFKHYSAYLVKQNKV